MLWIVGVVASVNLGEHPGHVVGQGAHGLHALGVERSLAIHTKLVISESITTINSKTMFRFAMYIFCKKFWLSIEILYLMQHNSVSNAQRKK